MVIDIEERCANLGISNAARFSAEQKYHDAFVKLDEGDVPFEDYPNIFNDEEMLAMIRWYGLDGRYPEYFTWDGYRYNRIAS